MEPHLLASGWQLQHPRILETTFYEAPSFASAEAVFIDPQEISSRWRHDVPVERDGRRRTFTDSDHGLGRTLSRLMIMRRTECSDLLHRGGGLLVCRLRPRGDALSIVGSEGLQERIDRLSWLPMISLVDRQHQLTFPTNGRFVPRKGRDVRFEGSGSPFEDYLREFDGHIDYTAVYQDLLSTPIERFATILARNRVGDIIALEIPFDDGSLILVPPVVGVPPSREAIALLRAVSSAELRPSFSPEPDWLPSFPFPGEEPLRDEVSSLEKRRASLAAKWEEAAAKLQAILGPKPMLYAKGRRVLLPAVERAFGILGFETDLEGGHLVVRSEEGDAVVAVAATESATVDVTAYRRLMHRVDRARTDGTGPDKGVLVVNASRELDPRHRPTQYTPAVLRGCESQRFCLVTAYELYKLVVDVAASSDDPGAAAAARRAICECDGGFRGIG